MPDPAAVAARLQKAPVRVTQAKIDQVKVGTQELQQQQHSCLHLPIDAYIVTGTPDTPEKGAVYVKGLTWNRPA